MSKSIPSRIKNLFFFNCIAPFLLFSITYAENIENIKPIDKSYLESKGELDDYILDTGDRLKIEFQNSPELSFEWTINEEGEIIIPRINRAFVRGLTIKELKKILEQRYQEFLLSPEIDIRIVRFKTIRVYISGEIRKPGFYKINPFLSGIKNSSQLKTEIGNKNLNINDGKNNSYKDDNFYSENNMIDRDSNQNLFNIKSSTDYMTTLSDVIYTAGGITSYSDLSKIKITREMPISSGGGHKIATINFNSYLQNNKTNMDLRIYDGDTIFIPANKTRNPELIPQSILSGLSPRFIQVTITGRIENTGKIAIPLEGTLNDVFTIAGPKEALAGKVKLIRYLNNGKIIRKNINFSSRAIAGSNRNPFLMSGDLISVRSNMIGRASGIIDKVTRPLTGIFVTKELLSR